jgi:hypothetical protein
MRSKRNYVPALLSVATAALAMAAGPTAAAVSLTAAQSTVTVSATTPSFQPHGVRDHSVDGLWQDPLYTPSPWRRSENR